MSYLLNICLFLVQFQGRVSYSSSQSLPPMRRITTISRSILHLCIWHEHSEEGLNILNQIVKKRLSSEQFHCQTPVFFAFTPTSFHVIKPSNIAKIKIDSMHYWRIYKTDKQ